MTEELKKYLWDINEAISRIEKVTQPPMTYQQFSEDDFLINGVERNFEIIGEALKRAIAIQSNLPISNIPKIIGMRNIIAHNYDKVEAINLWGTIKRNIPVLKSEVQSLLNE